MRFKGLDLNLLVALETLLSTRSVARSAERLYLSQPAMSAALSRLRHFFDDALLQPHGKRFHLTPTASMLLPRVQAWLAETDAMIGVAQGFDPATSRRTFRVIASDYSTIVLLVPLARSLYEEAAGVRIDIIPPTTTGLATTSLEDGSVDIVIGPEPYGLNEHPFDPLFEDRNVIAGCSTNPIFDKPFSLEGIAGARFATSTFGPDRKPSYGDQHFDAIVERHLVEVSMSSFATLPLFLPGTDRLAVLYERLAKYYATMVPIRFEAPQFEMPTTRFVMHYSRSQANDEGLSWLRERIRQAASQEIDLAPRPASNMAPADRG